jgi:hypothetical protein
VLDFLFIASIVYATDKLISRETAPDNWTRNLELAVPVSEIATWNKVKGTLESTLNFLTGDKWQLSFEKRSVNLYQASPGQKAQKSTIQDKNIQAVTLFSGGLDSLIGAIDWLEDNSGQHVLLISHYDGKVAGPKSDQLSLIEVLKPRYGDRIEHIQIRAGMGSEGHETTFRSRSLLFIAMGIYAASNIGSDTPLLIPENGTIAINIPLTPSRRGSCSTRTAHPYYLNNVRTLLTSLGINNPIVNPLGLKTKGECVEQCRNQSVLKESALLSVSCSKRGHTYTWKNRSANGCGFCMPCIYRRASLHRIGLDTEEYGLDICKGDVDPDNTEELALSLIHISEPTRPY